MNTWKNVFLKLNASKDVFARWFLKDGGYIYMYVPEVDEIAEEGFQGVSIMRYEEIDKIEIPCLVKHGYMEISNDIDEVKTVLDEIDGLSVLSSEDGLSVKLS